MTRAEAVRPDGGLLEIDRLAVSFASGGGRMPAVVDCSLTVRPATRVGLIGESGSGKSVTALATLGLLDPEVAAVDARSEIRYQGRDLLRMRPAQLRELRGTQIATVFQNPISALNPVFRIGDQMTAALRQRQGISRRAARALAIEALREVDIAAPARVVDAYPHQLSGGMSQRVLIGMALLERPQLIVADEPTSALDVTVQASILAMLRRVVDEHDMAVLLITHDMGVVAQFCEDVYVMYAGRVVESGSTASVLNGPQHPYTSGLLRSMPRLARGRRRLEAIPGAQPVAARGDAGCPFAPRCERATSICKQPPPLQADGVADHRVACHHPVPAPPR